MKILLQHLGNGRTYLQDVPAPAPQRGHILIRTVRSVVSPGTERMLVEFGRGNLLKKAQQQPERVRQVLTKMRTDGLLPTIQAVRRKLDQPIPLGYCNAGVVIGVGEGVDGFSVGDRVASNGYHAEVVSIPKNLVAKIPDDVSFDEAAFAPLAAIALHGFRISTAAVGETVAVIGLGLVGSLAAQWAKLAGCQVVGFDVSERAVTRAGLAGITSYNSTTNNADAIVRSRTGERGADAVLICTATDSAEPLRTATELCRSGASIILLGTAGMEIPRRAFFDKEIRFQVSRSYGPGRYDPAYEVGGQDYPVAHARWTAGRNIAAAVAAMSPSVAGNKLDVSALPTAAMDFEDSPTAYEAGHGTGTLATIFKYRRADQAGIEDRTIRTASSERPADAKGVGIIGAGPFVQGTLLPLFQALGAPLQCISSKTGASAGILAGKFGIPVSSSDYRAVIDDPAIGLVVIATPHNTHAALACEALQAGKAVYVEKPLALSFTELHSIASAIATGSGFVHVGHNRRFAPLAAKAKAALPTAVPRHIVATINAGVAPAPPGGRFLGEAGHWIDLCAFLADASVQAVNAIAAPDAGSTLLQMIFADGSTASLQYLTAGSARYEKERVEIHSAGVTAVIRAWRRLDIWSGGAHKTVRASQDKGHRAQLAAVLEGFKLGGAAPVPMKETMNVSRALLAAVQSAQERRWVEV